MDGRLIVLFATLTVFVASGVQGTSHLSFASNTTKVNITRDGCGTSKLCLEDPANCNPASNSTCLFVSFVAKEMAPNGANVSVELKGDTQPLGYVAMGLTQNSTGGLTQLFVCARNGSDNATFFQTLTRSNSSQAFSVAEIGVSEIVLLAKDNTTSCEFNILNVNATVNRISAATAFTVLVGTGTLTADGRIGTFTPTLNRTVNLADPANATGAMTAAPATTASSCGAVRPHVLLILLSVFTLFAMLRV